METLAKICKTYKEKYPLVQIVLHTATADAVGINFDIIATVAIFPEIPWAKPISLKVPLRKE